MNDVERGVLRAIRSLVDALLTDKADVAACSFLVRGRKVDSGTRQAFDVDMSGPFPPFGSVVRVTDASGVYLRTPSRAQIIDLSKSIVWLEGVEGELDQIVANDVVRVVI